MSILNSIANSRATMGSRIVLSGVEKVGKTTLACSSPRPLLVPLEMGYAGVDVATVPMLTHFAHVMSLLDEVLVAAQSGQFQYKTLVFDSATALEKLIHQAVLESDPGFIAGNKKAVTMESALGGYGRAYTYANELFANFLNKCDVLAQHGNINIVLTCHVFVAKIIDPTAGEYDCFDILLHSPKNQKTYGKREMLTQWADVVAFIHEPMFVTEGKAMNKGISANQGRMLELNRTPAYVAGNRYGVTGSIPLPKEKGWNFLADAIYQASGVDLYNRD